MNLQARSFQTQEPAFVSGLEILDAKRFEDGFSSFEAQDLQNLGVGQAIVRIERPEYDFTIDTVELKEPTEEGIAGKETVISLSREKYGTPREEVEKTLEYLRVNSSRKKYSNRSKNLKRKNRLKNSHQ